MINHPEFLITNTNEGEVYLGVRTVDSEDKLTVEFISKCYKHNKFSQALLLGQGRKLLEAGSPVVFASSENTLQEMYNFIISNYSDILPDAIN